MNTNNVITGHLSDAEIQKILEYEASQPKRPPTMEERMAALEEENKALKIALGVNV